MNAPVPELKPLHEYLGDDAIEVSLLTEPMVESDAGMPLLHLLSVLRKYHYQRDLSHQERFGMPDEQAQRALAELGDMQRSLQELTAQMGADSADVRIEASLNVRMATNTD